MHRQPRDLRLELLLPEHLDPAVNVGHGLGKGWVVDLVDERDEAVPGVEVGDGEDEEEAVLHTAAQEAGAEVEEHAVRHGPSDGIIETDGALNPNWLHSVWS